MIGDIDSHNVFKIFNLKVCEFLNDLKGVMHDVPEYVGMQQTVKLIIALNDRMLQKYFDTYVHQPYGAYIKQRNEEFFVHSVTEDNIRIDPSMTLKFGIVDMLKEKWSVLSDSDKCAIWDHFTLMISLSERCRDFP